MKIITIRDFRTRPAAVRREIEEESSAVLTASGKPFALVTAIPEGKFEEVSRAVQMARAQLALRELRKQAKSKGSDRLSMTDIDRLVARTRKARRQRAHKTGR